MSRVQAHTHKLKRHKYKTTGHAVFFCVLDCGFKVDVGLSLGKKVICWRCHKETTINEYNIRLARPICHDCVKHKTDETKVNVNVTTEELMPAVATGNSASLSDRLKSLTFSGGTSEEKDEEI